MQRLFLFFGLIIGGIASASSATPSRINLDYYFPDRAGYDEAIPTPASVIGFQPGEWHLRHDQIVSYLREIADRSDRMQLVEYARTHEEKPLCFLQVSDPKNLARLTEIQKAREAALNGDSADTPLIVWLGFSIHGNEPSGANAVPLLVYHLAAATGPRIERLLEETVILIDPAFNPDGLDRFAHWANTHRGSQLVADPNHREHTQPWPTGRSNHFWFDLNRDWLPIVHPESRGRITQFHRWRPHVIGDFHEMGTDRTFFFQPGVPARNNPLTPERNYELTARIAKVNARNLDAIGSLYYTRETFDDFYVGKGSTYPDLNGAIGILFEQASSRGHLQESDHGPVAFPFTIRNQLTAALGTLEAAHEMSDEIKAYSRWFYESAAELAAAEPIQAFVVASSSDPVRNAAFLDILIKHRIRVHHLAKDLEVDGESFTAGKAWIIPIQQPQGRLVKSLFERPTSFEENVFYDISTWALPPAFNLNDRPVAKDLFSAALLGSEVISTEIPEGEVHGRSEVGYVFSWDSLDAAVVLQRLLASGLKAKVATQPFTVRADRGRQTFTPGAILVPVPFQDRSADEIHELLEKAVDGCSVQVVAVVSGLAAEGVDLGSPSFVMLDQPRVMIAVGSGVSSAPAGETWHLFDQRLQMPVSLVETDRIGGVDLSRYTVIILPDGSYSALSSRTVGDLKNWVRSGGTLIVSQRAARWAVSKDLASANFFEAKADNASEPKRLPYGDADSIERLKRISGAILSAHVDSTHPLGYGFHDESITLFRSGTLFMEPSANPYYTPVLYRKAPLFSGYVSDKNVEALAESAAAIADPQGAGAVILFADNLNFRGYWLGSSRLFLNAVFFGKAIDSISVN